ncbi:MAG: hypothetical protein MUQ43_11165 [Reinekea forsetii]|uniref:Sel1 repeat family protein n=1 Tax=Reinekea forsetii TaxID=1336806 RepID=A0A2K8KNH0_9GAMM|nr:MULTISPECIES: hypothetical protein [Reinekea]ATX76348.1 hypothetical protein REIFOR_01202 [Reinekea forsetii]MDO7641292.1 hypothetical protein [Reinekea forsetii]MDO7644497.1 hypothetical protein [Reinekea forsetii]MDO7674976.1 hypothetical protein [Reinekea forsetii]
MLFRILQWAFHQRWLTWSKKLHGYLMKGFARLADRGDGDAQELYGFLLLFKGADQPSRSAGAQYLLRCVSVERPKVCWQLHRLYQEGKLVGFSQDSQRAQTYLDLAKQAGHPLALDLPLTEV